MKYARVHSIETFGTVDGPGIRYVLFLKGCPLRCQYCHNPDTWSPDTNQIMSVSDLVNDISRYQVFYRRGGVTVSGGEPLLQMDFLIEFFKTLKALGYHTAIDTSGITFDEENNRALFAELMRYTDLVLLDIKHIDNEKHKKLTRLPNTNVLAFAKYLSTINKPVWIRHVLVPGITTDEEDLRNLRHFLNQLQNIEKIEVIPYHTLGVYKYEGLKIDYPLKGVEPPTRDQIELANLILKVPQ